MVNVVLVEKIIDQLEKFPESLNQLQFGYIGDCGTTHCVAGWSLVLSGSTAYRWNSFPGYTKMKFAMVSKDPYVPLETLAMEAMGLSRNQADSLFYDFGDAEHILGRLRALIEEGNAEYLKWET